MFMSPAQLCFHVLIYSTLTVAVPIFNNGSYTNVILAFDRDVMVNKEQVENLKKLIKVASHELYIATYGMAFFKEVSVILAYESHRLRPIDNSFAIGRDAFSNADIRIESPNEEHGSDPYTLQTGECGEQGRFVRLTPSLFEDLNSDEGTKLAARRLLKEWARYRYGVFGEQESFRWEEKEISSVTCIDGIQGWAMTEALERCALDCGRVRGDCRFFPDLKSNSGVESSLMSYPHLPDVKHFCNSSDHNERAPSMQNKMCDSKSIMEIILEHEDFKDAHQWLDKSTKPVPPEETRISGMYNKGLFQFFFIVESSEIMEEENGTQMVQEFIERFFVYLAPTKTRVGFMKFSNESKILWKWMPVWDKDEWQKDAILNVSTPFGSLSATPDIGSALQQAYERYLTYFATIILISTGDGEIKDYRFLRNNSKVLIHSIAVRHNEQSWKLDHLSRMTGGDSYFLGGTRSRREPHSFNLDMAFLASTHSVMEEDLRAVVILYERFTLTEFGWNSYYFRVDDGIGKDLVVTVTHTARDTELYDPTNFRYHLIPGKRYQYGFGSTALSIFVDDAEPGIWRLRLWRESDEEEEHVDAMITAKPRGSMKGPWIWVRAWIANVTEDKKGLGTKGYHRIYAEVKKGFIPVIDATVVAKIEIPGQSVPIQVTLKDNGAVPDVFKDDGFYSNFFPVTERLACRAFVIVNVSNENGEAKAKTADCRRSGSAHTMLRDDEYQSVEKKFGPSKSRFAPNDFIHIKTNSCHERKEAMRFFVSPLSPFTRIVMANSPILFEMNETDVQRTPPASVRDLKVVNEFVRGEEFFVLLQWTSPEHPRLGMKVSMIEIRGSRNRELMTPKDFASLGLIFNESHILPAGEIQQLEVRIPAFVVKELKNHNVYLAMRASDNEGNTGEMSNVAEAFFERSDVEGIETESEAVIGKRKAAKGKTAGGRSWVPWTVGVIGMVMVIVAAVLAAIGYRKWRKKD